MPAAATQQITRVTCYRFAVGAKTLQRDAGWRAKSGHTPFPGRSSEPLQVRVTGKWCVSRFCALLLPSAQLVAI